MIIFAIIICYLGIGAILSYALWPHENLKILERVVYSWLLSLVIFPLSFPFFTSALGGSVQRGFLGVIFFVIFLSIAIYASRRVRFIRKGR